MQGETWAPLPCSMIRPARRTAHALGVPLAGTLGLIVAAAQAKLIPSLPAAIQAVRAGGLYVDPATVSRLLEERD